MKGKGDGLCIALDPTQPLEVIQDDISRLFARNAHRAANARITLDIGDADGFDDVVDHLEAFLKTAYDVGSVTRAAPRRRDRTEQGRARTIEGSWHEHRSDALWLTGRVRSGQKVTARRHLLIMGDVNPGAEVLAGGDIVVLGSLRGTAVAGQPDDQNAIILALHFQPTQIQIGGVVAAGLPPSRKKVIEYAYVEKNSIVVENYLNTDPFGRLPWPQAR